MSATAPHRARVIGTRHMAAAGHYLAAQTALQVLEAGGNAVDAGVAGGIALSVLQSEYVSFGGVAPIMIRLAGSGAVHCITGVGPWPRRADLAVFRDEHGGRIPPGLLRSVVPAAPDAWITALERFGTMSFGETAAAAERFATEGFPLASLSSAIIAKYAADYARYPSSAAIYLPDGRPPAAGALFRQTDLGRTLRYMMDEERAAARRGRQAGLEAARDAFYRGDIASAIVRFQADNGGWLDAEDLASFSVDVEPAHTVRFAGTDVHFCGPWCQGPLLGQTLRLLDAQEIEALGHNTPAYVHHLVEALKLAYADRHRYYGDPKFVDVPLERLLSADYARERRRLVDPARACPGMPDAGLAPAPTADDAGALDTSYIAVVDRHGNTFSATPSDASAASPVVPGLGFVVSNRGSQSWTDPTVPAVLAPGKRPRLTPNPAIASRGDDWVMPFGSPGNDMQPQAMLQALLNVVLWDRPPQEAVEAPRFGSASYPRSSEPHGYDPGLLHVEARLGAATIEALRARGHDVRSWPNWEWVSGAVCLVVADRARGMFEGAADPRRPTGIAGW